MPPQGFFSWLGWLRWTLLPRVRYAVITRIPPAGDSGNLYDELLFRRENLYTQLPYPDEYAEPGLWRLNVLHVRLMAFELGEVLLVDRNGREVAGQGRKPDKWCVGCEYFWTRRAALRRARQVLPND